MRKASYRIGRSLLDAGSLSSSWRKETSVPRKAEMLPEATLLPGVRSAQVTANSGRVTSRQGAGDGQGRREDAGEARGSCRRPLERTRGIEKGKQPQTCFIARTESGAGGVWPCPAGRRRTRPLRGRRDQAQAKMRVWLT